MGWGFTFHYIPILYHMLEVFVILDFIDMDY